MSCCGGGEGGHGHDHGAAPKPAEAPIPPGVRVVKCVKIGKDLPGLNFKPFKGELGQKIHDGVSAQAWKLWTEHAKILLNEYRMNLAMPEATKFLMEQCDKFFFGEGAQLPAEWAPAASKK